MRWSWQAATGLMLGAVAVAVPSPTAAQRGAQAPATGAATIQGVVTSSARPPGPIRVSFDQKVCGAELPDGSVQVAGPGLLANAVVTVVGLKSAAPGRVITVLNDRCAFVPRVQVARPGGTVRTSSRDPILHTTVVQQPDGRQLFNVALPVPGLEIAKPLGSAGVLRVGCSTHQWMRAWIVVTDDVSAVTGGDGRFTLPGVPPGNYQLRVWHESLQAADRTVTVTAGKTVDLALEMK